MISLFHVFDDGASSRDEIRDFDLARMFGELLGFCERLVHLGEDVHQLAVNDQIDHLDTSQPVARRPDSRAWRGYG